VFRRLGVFAGSFDRSTAGAVLTLHGEDAANVEAVVPALVRDALVQVDRRDPGRLHFRLLSVVRGLALEAVPAGELDQLRLRHRRWFADWWSRELGRDELFQDIRDHQEDYLQALTTGWPTVTARRQWIWRSRSPSNGSCPERGGRRQMARPGRGQLCTPAGGTRKAAGAAGGVVAGPRSGPGIG
jgi:hypothetical protein